MKDETILIFALGLSPEWCYLKKILTKKNQKFTTNLLFEKDWQEFQLEKFGWYDETLTIISIVKNEMILGIDHFREEMKNKSHNFTKKFFKSLSTFKKYIEWEIMIKNTLKTVVIELDFSICPRTCENFWQICTKKSKISYVNSKFHRSVPNNFIEGGIIYSEFKSIYGDYFPDENFKYLHDRSGVIGMSKEENKGNGTCFYITLRPILYFNSRNVAFGRIVAGMDHIFEISRAHTENQRIIDQITIVNSRDLLGKQEFNEQSLNVSSSYRDLANELLKNL